MLILISRWAKQLLFDPRRTWGALQAIPGYLRDLRRFRFLARGQTVRLVDMQPELHDRSTTTPVDDHYFYANWWTMNKIQEARPSLHLDVGSQAHFASLLSAVVPVIFLDYRPLTKPLPGLMSLGGDALRAPLRNDSIQSLSSVHVVEHVGLGRYGDPLDPQGSTKALREMARVLKPGGDLYVATPIGRRRVNFNAHRVHNASDIITGVGDLVLEEFSVIGDDGRLYHDPEIDAFDTATYACGLFHFRRNIPAPTQSART